MPSLTLLSGGLDSAVTLAIARAEFGAANCFAISFDYGQRHRHELEASKRVAAHLGLPPAHHLTLTIDLRPIGGSALTDPALAVPKDRPAAALSGGVPITYVPARNLIFLSLATAYAETLNATAIYIGVNAVDYSGYPDCREEFIRAFETTANLGTASYSPSQKEGAGGRVDLSHPNPLRILTPLVHLSKPDIIRRGHALGVNFSLTHSCYDPITRHGQTLACGHCDACQIRAAGFREAGIPDPTRYA